MSKTIILLFALLLCLTSCTNLPPIKENLSNEILISHDPSNYLVELSTSNIEPIEKFNQFLAGECCAINKNGSKLTIEDFKTYAPCQYTFFDMNNDNIQELCILTSKQLSIFWIKDNKILLWREDSHYCRILDNSAILYERHGAAPEHYDYIYYETDYQGNTTYKISFSKYAATEINGIFYPELYMIDGTKTDKSTYEKLTNSTLNLSYNSIIWHDL